MVLGKLGPINEKPSAEEKQQNKEKARLVGGFCLISFCFIRVSPPRNSFFLFCNLFLVKGVFVLVVVVVVVGYRVVAERRL